MVNNMKIWINKCCFENTSPEYCDALVFNLCVPGQATGIASSIRDSWYRLLGTKNVTPICEDLYIIALAIFAADKRIPRSWSQDGWTRTLCVSIPVMEKARWDGVKAALEKTLSYLSGDKWEFSFRHAHEDSRYVDSHIREHNRNPLLDTIDCISLFSGGLDSFCGAYDLLSRGKNTIFVGFKEYGKLEYVQKSLMENLSCNYPNTGQMLFTFTAKAYSPIGGHLLPPENTSRSRSFLFIAAAISVADVVGRNVPVFIPENGFIGLNLPLTTGRSGSCSTRTTHPYFLKMLNSLLDRVGIAHRIINPFAFNTKREMVQQFIDYPGFSENIHKTISCSHPCNGRWHGKTNPENCGYCYPCLIRQSSLIGADVPNEVYGNDVLSLEYIMNSTNAKRSDFVDLLSSVSTAVSSSDEVLLRRINATGKLSSTEALSFLRLYRTTIQDVIQLISVDPELVRIIGLPYEPN